MKNRFENFGTQRAIFATAALGVAQRINKNGAPRDKFFLGRSWNRGGWRFDATATRFGEFHTFNDDPSGIRDQTFAAKWTLDLAATYAVDGWEFTVGGDNVLNEYPDESIYANSESGQLPYTSYAPFGFNGAFAYAKVGYKW